MGRPARVRFRRRVSNPRDLDSRRLEPGVQRGVKRGEARRRPVLARPLAGPAAPDERVPRRDAAADLRPGPLVRREHPRPPLAAAPASDDRDGPARPHHRGLQPGARRGAGKIRRARVRLPARDVAEPRSRRRVLPAVPVLPLLGPAGSRGLERARPA